MSDCAVVRPFAESDRDACRNIFLAARRAAFTWLDPAALQAADFDTATEGERIWVAERLDEVVGFASVWVPERFLHNLFVHPRHQGRGIGSALLAACWAEIGGPMRLKCARLNARALAFYQRRAWRIESEGEGPEGGYYVLRWDGENP